MRNLHKVTHKLKQTIVTSDIDNFDPDRATSAIPIETTTTPSLDNPRQDGTAATNSLKHPAYNQCVQTKVIK